MSHTFRSHHEDAFLCSVPWLPAIPIEETHHMHVFSTSTQSAASPLGPPPCLLPSEFCMAGCFPPSVDPIFPRGHLLLCPTPSDCHAVLADLASRETECRAHASSLTNFVPTISQSRKVIVSFLPKYISADVSAPGSSAPLFFIVFEACQQIVSYQPLPQPFGYDSPPP